MATIDTRVPTLSKRERFFDESLKLIHEKGFKATTMRDIAQRMNFEVANIYNYIGSKQELLDKFLFEIAQEFSEGIQQIFNSSYDPREKLRAVISLHVQLGAKKPYQIGLVFNEWRNLPLERKKDYVRIRRVHLKLLQEIIEDGIKIGLFRNINPFIATQSIFSAMGWIYVEFARNGKELNPFEIEKQMSDLLLRGIEP